MTNLSITNNNKNINKRNGDDILKLKRNVASKRFYDIQNLEFRTDSETGKVSSVTKTIIAVAENDAFRENLINILLTLSLPLQL